MLSDAAMSWVQHIAGITGSGFGITLVTSFVRWRLPKIPHFISMPGIAIGVGLFVTSLIPFLRGPTVLAGIGSLALAAFAVEWQLSHPSVQSEANNKIHDLSIRDFWLTDFSEGGSYKLMQSFDTDLTNTDHRSLGRIFYGVGLYGNFDSKSLFMSIYVPQSSLAKNFIYSFGGMYQGVLNDTRQYIKAWAAPQGDNAQRTSEDLKFTGKVFVYYDGMLTDAELAELRQHLISSGLDPTFRGLQYVEYRRLRIAAGEDKAPIVDPAQARNMP